MIHKLGDLIDDLKKKSSLYDNRTGLSLERNWISVVGEKLASLSSVREICEETLIVEISDAGGLWEISNSKRKIIKNLKKTFPELKIKKIEFVKSFSETHP